jgi:hypothetical protein
MDILWSISTKRRLRLKVNLSIIQMCIEYFDMVPGDTCIEDWSPFAMMLVEENKRKVIFSNEYERTETCSRHRHYITVALYDHGLWIFDHRKPAKEYLELIAKEVGAVRVDEHQR